MFPQLKSVAVSELRNIFYHRNRHCTVCTESCQSWSWYAYPHVANSVGG